jgi:hypothetical protein
MLRDALKLLGLSTPFIYALVAYGVFHFLDAKASGQAKRAISSWFKPFRHDKAAVAAAMVEVFDRLYTTPLLGWRAFLRSTCFTLAVTSIFVVEMFPLRALFAPLEEIAYFIIRAAILSNIVSDYVSLFVIRRWLVVAGYRPLFALLTGPLAGGFVIVLVYYVRDVVLVWFLWGGAFFGLMSWLKGFLVWVWLPFESSDFPTSSFLLFWPAVAVLLWLPLFALGALFVKAVNSFVWAVGKTQWFLKQGQHHPLQAVGYVAAVIVFAGITIVHVVWR